MAASQLDAVGGCGCSVGINKCRSTGALDEEVVAGGVGGEQGSVGRSSGQCPGSRGSTGGSGINRAGRNCPSGVGDIDRTARQLAKRATRNYTASAGDNNPINDVGLKGGEQRLDVGQIGVDRHGPAGKRTKAFNDRVPLATHDGPPLVLADVDGELTAGGVDNLGNVAVDRHTLANRRRGGCTADRQCGRGLRKSGHRIVASSVSGS